ncbi:hypothetical protein Patl1_29279 [Pistacia atlantica]|uniref:Uncharacterized protein n=1 Tax=Pistacia atlantica TaxID=434234 RepID=A0ACC1BFR4_9ROSI|nr:hypothetical protein Patl1_29279 [Pistacia atlantica]
MGTIKRLPETVRNTVRSGVVLFDLTRVVEELVFNSLDAGATKVSVFVGVGTSFVKVVDNGCGISRDGLMLLGERYATSKLQHLADMDAASRTFGYRGEALASISDVSLLEIMTKAYGRPNGYRKVMKGSKCLYLGIDDDRKEVGTTVVARDLFYNQPVRRKYMQSSPKKVLHLVKKCVFRIALVHPKASFKVVDIESGDELLSTHFASSPLSLLRSGFGTEDSSFLHEISAKDDLSICLYPCLFKSTIDMQFCLLSWDIEDLVHRVWLLTFIMADINSRFICKGPIHKLVNNLASNFDCLDSWKANNGSQKGKKSRSQVCPTYILNLGCPQALYDLTFEPSKTYVVFKDWEPVLTFIEKAVQTVWMKDIVYGESFSHAADKLGKDELWKKHDNLISAGEFFDGDGDAEFALETSRFPIDQASFRLPSSLEKLTKNNSHLYHGERERTTFREFQIDTAELDEKNTEMEFVCQSDYSFRSSDGSFTEWLTSVPQREVQIDTAELEEKNTEMESFCQTDYSFQSSDSLFARCLTTVPQNIDQHPWTADIYSSSKEDYLLDNSFAASGKSNTCVEDELMSFKFGKEYVKIEPVVSSGLSENALNFHRDEFSHELETNMNIKKPYLSSCSSGKGLPFGGASFAGVEEFECLIDRFKYKRRRILSDERDDILEVDASDQGSDLYSKSLWQDEASCAQHVPKVMSKGDIPTSFDLLSRVSPKTFPSYGESFTEETSLLSDSNTRLGKSVSGHQSLNSEWCNRISDPFYQAASWDVGHFDNKNGLEGSSRLGKGANYGQLDDTLENCNFGYDIRLKSTNQENCTSIHTSTALDFKDYHQSSEYFFKLLQEQNLPNRFSPEHSDMLVDKTDWLRPVSYGQDFSKNENLRRQFRYDNRKPNPISKERSRRSHSAPPFHRHKRRFISLSHCSKMQAGESNINTFHCALTSPEAGLMKNLHRSSGECHPNLNSSSEEDLELSMRPTILKKPDTVMNMKKTQKVENFKQLQCLQAHHAANIKDFISKEILDSIDSGTKWRNSCPQATVENNNRSSDIDNQDNILDISSGLLHLAGDSLIPESISKNCLEYAKVLQQVDKKFIPIVAGGTLALIDQHAADERIRLEELRRKVLSEEGKTVTYLDAEQELVLPEIGYQLLHNYAQQMKDWGWICNIHNQGSRSFKKNLNLLHQRPTIVTLLAVPCILGVNLSDVDLLEFLQQLADTDGSSTIPPAVLRVLNSKACRGTCLVLVDMLAMWRD